ncbi:hypothetical protein [Bifidobacterium choerinum]|nr:hypothetical protein [Bifidobacterium choerinum]
MLLVDDGELARAGDGVDEGLERRDLVRERRGADDDDGTAVEQRVVDE